MPEGADWNGDITHMTLSPHRETARIYAFAPRSRLVPGTRRPGAKPVSARPDTGPPACDFGAGWYHDAAILDSDPARKP